MADVYEGEPRVISEEHPLPKASLNSAGLMVLAVILICIPAFLVYSYIHVKSLNSLKKPQKTVLSSAKTIDTPTPTLRIIIPPSSTPQPTVTQVPEQTKNFSDITYTVPSGWEAVKQFGDEKAYQIAFRQKGRRDSPIVINVYKNTDISFDDFINAQAGQSAVKEKHDTEEKHGMYVKRAGDESYFLTKDGAYIQVAAVLNDAKIHNYFDAIYASIQAK